MKISVSEVTHVAQLARLKLTGDELERFQKELNAILEYMDMLKEVDTEGAIETVHSTAFKNRLRDDVVQRSQQREDALLNAPRTHEGQIVVPKVLE